MAYFRAFRKLGQEAWLLKMLGFIIWEFIYSENVC